MDFVKYLGKVMQCSEPSAYARIRGSEKYPCIRGDVYFYEIPSPDCGRRRWCCPCSQDKDKPAVLVAFFAEGMTDGVHGFHIHEGRSCSGTPEQPFAGAKGHYNPENRRHPGHAGDLPPLFVCNGRASGAVLLSGFNVCEIIGRTVIVHQMPDDFTTQPSGNSGEMTACGVICRR